MNLRQNGLTLLLATALLAIAAQWAGNPAMVNLWALPLGLLLLGLAYERWVCARAAIRLSIHSPMPWHLAQGAETRWQIQHALPLTLTVMLAPSLPGGVDAATLVQTVQVPAHDGVTIGLPAVARRLGRIRWPAQPGRMAGPLGLAWWSFKLQGGDGSTVVPAMLTLKESAVGAARADRGSARRLVRVRKLNNYATTRPAIRCGLSTGAQPQDADSW